MNISIIPFLDAILLLSGIFYALNLKLTFNRIISCLLFIFIPAYTISQIIGLHWLAIIYFFIIIITIFLIITKSIWFLLHLNFLLFGELTAKHFSTSINKLLLGNVKIDLVMSVITYILCYSIIVYIYKIILKELNSIKSLPFSIKNLIILITCVMFIYNYTNLYNPFKLCQVHLLRFNEISQVISLILMLLLFNYIYKSVKLQTETNLLAKEQDKIQYMKTLERVNKEMRRFQHDYANILLTMRCYLENNNLEGLKNYFYSHILAAGKQTLLKNEVFSNLDNLKDIELKGLLSTKVIYADQLGIKVRVDIPETIEAIDMNIIDLTRIIGIFVDNAIEAASQIDDGEVHIAFINTQNNSVIICIDNSYGNKPINIDDIYTENYSTKGTGRGIGLSTVKELLDCYPTVKLNTYTEEGWFIQELEIPIHKLSIVSST